MTASVSKLAAIVCILTTTSACGTRQPPDAGKGNNAMEELNEGVMNEDLANNAVADPGNDVAEPEDGNNAAGPADNATGDNGTAPPQ